MGVMMINGDTVSGIWQRIAYFPQCIISGFKGNKNNVDLKKLQLNKAENIVEINETFKESGSPARRLSNMFWSTINWQFLSNQLNNNVNILDLGCGRGNYGYRYKRLLGKNFCTYTGVDIFKSSEFPSEFSHILSKAENIHTHIKEHNFIVSQSALEHVENDTKVLTRITNEFSKSGKPYLQVHLVPASAALFLYLWHGWRQYSKKNLGNIIHELSSSNDLNAKIIPLGGLRCFIAHFWYITIPTLISQLRKSDLNVSWDTKTSKVSSKIKKSVLADYNVDGKFPIFWALVISSKHIDLDSLFI